jgi:hypothetical protein
VVEPNFGDGMFNELLNSSQEEGYPCGLADAERSAAHQGAEEYKAEMMDKNLKEFVKQVVG